MSLILDALRKSEAERRRSETPDLLAAVSTAPPPQTRRSPAIPTRTVAIAASAVVLMVALVFWLDWRARRDVIPVGDDRIADIAMQTNGPGPAPLSPPGNGDTVDAADPAPDAVVAPPAMPPPTASSLPPSTAPSPTPPPASAAIDPPATLPSPRTQAEAIPRPAPVAAPIVSTPATTPTHGSVTTDPGAPLAPSQLGAETRRQMPPLKMSMHLWNEAASQRFVVLDGQRLGEGDVVGDVVVERIDRDAVIVVWRGERVRLPVR